jgi:hypothetical protein
LGVFHIFHVFSLFNLPFFHIVHSSSHSVEMPLKTRYKHKQNETHYENITH